MFTDLADHDEIDDDYVEDAADICDQTVTVQAGSQNRYTTNGSFTMDAFNQVLTNLSQAMAGMTWYTQGSWAMKAGSYTTPVFSGANAITDDDLRSPIQVTTKSSRRDSYNKISGIYRGRKQIFKTSYPTLAPSTFLTEDSSVENGLKLICLIPIPAPWRSVFPKSCLQTGKTRLSVTFSLRCLQLAIGDVVEVTYPRFGWDAKTFEVVDWNFGLNMEPRWKSDCPLLK